MRSLLITLLMLLNLGVLAQRNHVIFFSSFENTSLSEWTGKEYCQVNEVSSTNKIKAKDGSYVGRFYSTINDTLSCTGMRSQLIFGDNSGANFERWYGFSIYLNNTFPAIWEGKDNLLEFYRTDTVEAYSPFALTYYGQANGISTRYPTGLYLTGDRFERSDTARVKYSPYTWDIFPVGPITTGTWMDIVIRAKWASDTSGRIRVWINDTLQYSYNGPTNYGPLKLRVGIDKWGWRFKWGDYKTAEREFFVDEFRIGDSLATYADVRPSTITPITWLSFVGSVVNNYIAIKWNTNPSTSVAYYSLQKNINSVWQTISNQNPNSLNEYTYNDLSPLTVNNYRVRVTNTDSSLQYSPGLTVNYNGAVPVTIYVYDTFGRLRQTLITTNVNISYIKSQLNLPRGVYILKYSTGQTQKIFLSK